MLFTKMMKYLLKHTLQASDEEIDKLEKAFGKHTHVIIIYMVGFNIFGSMDQDLMLYSHRCVNSRAQDTNEMLFH